LTTLHLTINKSTTGSVTVTSCDSYFWHGTTYTTSGAYTFDNLNVKGCDSLTTLYLTINKSTTGSVTVTSCDSYFWHGTTYTTSGAYTFDSLNVKGCDSLTTLNLTIHKSTSATIFQFACDSYTWHGTTYNTSGNYTFDSLNAQGCDSLTTLSLTIDNFKIDSIGINPNFVTAGAPLAVTLYANNPIASATWSPDYLFSSNSATQSIIVPDNAFRIAVTGYSTNGCIDTASRYIEVKNVDMFIPNAIAPANNDIRVRTLMAYGAAVKSAELSVYNQWGQLLYHSSDAKYPGGTGWDGTYNGKKQPSGVYVYVMKMNYYNNKTETKTGSVNLIR
jgi:gliding motility-associated-like protein